MEIKRYLTKLEEARVGGPGLSIISYEGRVVFDRFRKAVELLQQKNPVLRARLSSSNETTLLCAETSDEPLLNLYSNPDFDIPPEVNQAWDPSVGVASWTLTQFENSGILTLRTDQSIIDGTGIIATLDELWRIYTLLEGGFTISMDDDRSLPVPDSPLLRERWDPNFSDSPRVRRQNARPVRDVRNRNLHRVRLTKSETSAVVYAAHSFGVSVHAIVSGAILVALRKLNRSLEPISMTCVSSVNLRPHVDPLVGKTETTHFAVNYLASPTVPLNASPRVVGSEVMEDFYDVMSHRVLKDSFVNPTIDEEGARRAFMDRRLAWITNLGKIKEFCSPGNIDITDYRLVSSPQVYAVTTYKNRLSIECDYIDEFISEHEANRLDKEIHANLRMSAKS